MKFLKLTEACPPRPAVWINMELVTSLQSECDGCKLVTLSPSWSTYLVQETPEQILAMLEEKE